MNKILIFLLIEKKIENLSSYINYIGQYRNFDFLIISNESIFNSDKSDYPNINSLVIADSDFFNIIKDKLNFGIRINKLTDYIPYLGYIFNNNITTHTHWGATEITNIFGDLNSFHDDIIDSDIYAVYNNKTTQLTSIFVKIDTTDKIIKKNIDKNINYIDKMNELSEFIKVKKQRTIINTDFYNSNIFYNKNKFFLYEDNSFIECFSFTPLKI
jgi:hypothetical protein